MKREFLAAFATVWLSSCASVPESAPVTVYVPVVKSCVTERPGKLIFESLSDNATDFEKVQELTIRYVRQKQHINDLEAVIEGCL